MESLKEQVKALPNGGIEGSRMLPLSILPIHWAQYQSAQQQQQQPPPPPVPPSTTTETSPGSGYAHSAASSSSSQPQPPPPSHFRPWITDNNNGHELKENNHNQIVYPSTSMSIAPPLAPLPVQPVPVLNKPRHLQNSSASYPTKRGRGRPPGTKNKNGPKKPVPTRVFVNKAPKVFENSALRRNINNYFEQHCAPRIPGPPIHYSNNIPPTPPMLPTFPYFYSEGSSHHSSPSSLPGTQFNGMCEPDYRPKTQNFFVLPPSGEYLDLPEVSHCLAWAKQANCADLYENFLRIENKYPSERSPIDKFNLFQEMCQLFVHHPHIIDELSRFVPFNLHSVSSHDNSAFQSSAENVVQEAVQVQAPLHPSQIPAATVTAPDISEQSLADTKNNIKSPLLDLLSQFQCNPMNAPGAAETLNALVLKRLSANAIIYQQYQEIMNNFCQFSERAANNPCSSLQMQLRFEEEKRRVLERILDLLKDEPDLSALFRQLFIVCGFMPVEPEVEIRAVGDLDNNNNTDQVLNIDNEEIVCTENDVDVVRFQNQSTFEQTNSTEAAPVTATYTEDLTCHESLSSEFLTSNPAIIIMRIKDYPSLFDFYSSDFTEKEDFMQILEDRVSTIIKEDADRDKWKLTLLQALSRVYVFDRAPQLLDSIRTLMKFEGPVISRETTTTTPPCCVHKLAEGIEQASSIPLEGSYVKCPAPVDGSDCCSGRTELCQEVLNDEFRSQPSVTVPFKLPFREDEDFAMDAFEDARYEVDMLLYTIDRTIDFLEKIETKMSRMSEADLDHFEIEDLLGEESVATIKVIEKLYKGDRVLTGLKKFPTLFVPRVLAALKVREKEWAKIRGKWNILVSDNMYKLQTVVK